MARFKIGDKIELVRTSAGTDRVVEVLQKGVVITGPIKVDKVDHYNIEWNWTNDGIQWANTKNDIISDLKSKKYQYRKI
jgi:hypothetical protein